MQEMGIKCLRFVGQFAGHDASLTKAANTVTCHVAAQITKELATRIAKPAPGHRPEKPPEHAHRLLMQIFGQVIDGRTQLIMQRMCFVIGRVAQRPDSKIDARSLQSNQLLRDKCL